ncbi:hypothetical protein R1flu_011558 [Riccia fluitans]|uniref:Protein kinase domain-containing protein n=1 Tax=Riccia fluitans TaxID=41844 RepID=A0ABD1Z853_9MARC
MEVTLEGAIELHSIRFRKGGVSKAGEEAALASIREDSADRYALKELKARRRKEQETGREEGSGGRRRFHGFTMQGDVVLDKENVGPRAWGPHATLLKNKGLVAGHDALRKEKAGVLTSNSATNNGGGAIGLDCSLESIRERVKLLKLGVNGASVEAGSRLAKPRTPLADIKPYEGTLRSMQLKDGTGHATLHERSTAQSVDMSSFSKMSHSRASSVEQSERNPRNLHSSGGHVGLKSHWTGSSKSLELYHDIVKPKDQAEVNRSAVEAWVSSTRQSQEQKGSNPLVRSLGERQHVKAMGSSGTTGLEPESRHSLSTSRDGGVWSRAKLPVTPYKRSVPLLDKDNVAEFRDELEVEKKHNGIHSDMFKSSSALLPKTDDVEYSGTRDKEKSAGLRVSFDGILTSHNTLSFGRAHEKQRSEDLGSSRLTTAELQSNSFADVSGGSSVEKKTTFYGSTGLTKCSGIGVRSEPVIASEENEPGRETSKLASVLLSKMTGTSSSGSSATPSSGCSSNDDDTVGYPGRYKRTPPLSGEKEGSSLLERLSRSRKRWKALGGPAARVLISGPPGRVLTSSVKNGVGSDLEAVSPVTPEVYQKVPDSDLLGDLKKRKAEDDLSIGDVSQADNVCSAERKSPAADSVQSAVASVHRFLRATSHGESNEAKPRLQKVEEIRSLQPTHQRGAESLSAVGSQLSWGIQQPDGSSNKRYGGLVSSQEMSDVRQPLPMGQEKAPRKELIDRSVNSVLSSVPMERNNSPSSDALWKSSEPVGSRISSSKKLAQEVKEGREAVSMSHDGFPQRDKSETRPGHLHELSNSLGSLVDRDIQTKTQSRPPLQTLVNTSPSSMPFAAVNQYTTKSLENVGGVLTTSHSSALTTENVPPNQNPRTLSPEMQRKELPATSQEKLSKEPKVEASFKPRPSEGYESAAPSNAPGQEGVKEDGKVSKVPEKRKVFEDKKFFWVSGQRYQKLGMIGKGGSSEVYKVIDSEFSIYALKKIILGGRDHSTARGYYQEIEYLVRLRGKRHIVQLIDYEVTNRNVVDENYGEEKIQEDACIYVVLEFGEIDLAGILNKKRKEMLESSEPLDDNWIRFYWKHMLVAVKTIHEERIVHADLKPANFLLVKGELKLIDFGIAKAIQSDTTHVARDAQVGTLNYMSPEALMNSSSDEDDRVFKCGRSSDIWSLGCILYQMVYGHTPFSDIRNMYRKIQAITSKDFKIPYLPVRDPWLVDAMQRCLTWDRFSRPNIQELLLHPFLRPDLAPPK